MRRSSPGNKCGFTLIELLMAVAIIVILMGLVLKAVSTVRNSARMQRARTDEEAIVTGIKAFYGTYGHFPAQEQYENDRTTKDGTGGSMLQGNIYLALLARSTSLNSRAIVFLESRAEGPLTCPVSGCWLDPWGEHYIVAMDEDGSGNVDLSCGSFSTTVVETTVAIVTTNGSRDVCSWQ